MDISKAGIVEVAEQARCLLNDSREEWEGPYSEYASSILANLDKISANKVAFHEWAPLHLYTTVGDAKTTANKFQLRFKGQKVAELKIRKDTVLLNTPGKCLENNTTWFGYDTLHQDTEWRSSEAAIFRKHFSLLGNDSNPRQQEHKYECMILTEMGKSDKEIKFQGTFSGVQPVKVAGVSRFQMKTPFSASQKNALKFVGQHGGDRHPRTSGKRDASLVCV